MLATPILLSGSGCWPRLCFCLDPDVGHTYSSVWILMLATPLLLSGSECWPHLFFCLDPYVGHNSASVWIRMLATPMPLNPNFGHACASAWIRILVMPLLLPGSQCRMLMKERKISVETVEIAFPRSCHRIESDGP